MKKVTAFGASSSRASINKILAEYAAKCTEMDFNLLDLNDYEMPIYSIDREIEIGIPEAAIAFRKSLKEADGLIIAFAEHNGSFTAAFKNIYDWMSRIEKNLWMDKPMLLLATSLGPRGGAFVLNHAVESFGFRGGHVKGQFALPSFGQNFVEGALIEGELKDAFMTQLNLFKESLM